ncbi:ribonucleotide reductase [Candidatus Parcubacteria bacterium]|nr:MAG: ribonucleotide reductase [Candidatus Parcubacteria bacterium]
MKTENTVKIKQVRKRDGNLDSYNNRKIVNAIFAGMKVVKNGSKEDATKTALEVERKLAKIAEEYKDAEYIPNVEEIQDLVEQALMENGFHSVAKEYILYREKRRLERKRDIFKKRVYLKPYEYPEFIEYIDAIRHSYWIHTEFNYTSDVQDFKVNISDLERNVIKNTMLAISQIEVAVKMFWADIYKKLPKPEIASVGVVFAESEVRHQDAYSHLLEILGLNNEFKKIFDVPVINQRIKFLSSVLETSKSEDNREYVRSILYFSLFIEHVSLFSQFLIMMSFNKFKNVFKGISNAVEATSKEEQIHGLFGISIIKTIKEEHPDWFDEELTQDIYDSCEKAYEVEEQVVDWIFENGELDFLPKDVIKEFIKSRLNNSLHAIGLKKTFKVDKQLLEKTEWFDDEIIATKHNDFFNKRSVNYNKRSKSVTSNDLF